MMAGKLDREQTPMRPFIEQVRRVVEDRFHPDRVAENQIGMEFEAIITDARLARRQWEIRHQHEFSLPTRCLQHTHTTKLRDKIVPLFIC